jgi:hypothetical protein
MKINPSIRKKNLLYPMAAAVVLAACQQQQRLGGVPLPPPGVQPEEPVVKPQEEEENTRPQRVVGRKAVREGREKNQPLPGKKRASR